MVVLGATPSRPQPISNVLGLLIPTDLFTALSQNAVPGVVVLCIFYGVAIPFSGRWLPACSPDARIVVVPDYRVLPDFAQVDAAVWSLEQAAA